LECYQFFQGHYYRSKILKQETFMPYESFNIYYNPDDQTKIDAYFNKYRKLNQPIPLIPKPFDN